MNWRYLLLRKKWDRERFEEIESYIQIETDDNIARGMPEPEARAAARRKFGNTTLVREEIYRMNTVTFLDAFARDVRYGLRALRHNPLFTAVALLTLAIGIGANTAVFSVVNGVLLKPLRYPKPDELVALRQMAPGAPGLASFSEGLLLSPSLYYTYAEHNRTFQSLGVWSPGTAAVTGLAEPEQVRTIGISDGVLQTLAVPPVLGRWFSAADQIPARSVPASFSGSTTTVILSYGYWQRRFGGDRSVIGRNLTVDSNSREIVGVMPQGFRLVSTDFDLLQPLAFQRNKLPLAGFGFEGVGRLQPGVAISQANADLKRLLAVWMDSWSNGPGTDSHFYEQWKITPAIRPLKQDIVGAVSDVLWVVMATSALLMLIVCANVTNLLLVRAEVRRHELALRSALGAGTGRIVGSLLVESATLGLLGGILAIGVAYAGLRLLVAVGPANLPRLGEISIDAGAEGFTFVLSIVSGLLFGLIPALKYTGGAISTGLAGAGRGGGVSRERHRTRSLLVIAQVAMAMMLLIGAGLMIRTFQALRNVDPGFARADRIQTMRISIPGSLVGDPQLVFRIQNEIVDKLAAIPGVTSVGFASQMPMEDYPSNWDAVFSEDTPPTNTNPPMRLFQYVSPGFFQTMGTKIVAGRELTWSDVYNQRPVVLVSANLARELWGSPSAAVGKHLREIPSAPWSEVIGVLQDIRDHGLQNAPPETVYWPSMTTNLFGPSSKVDTLRSVTFAIRSDRTGTQGFLGQVQQAVWSVNASLPVAAARTMQDIYDQSMARTSFTLVMLGIAGAMALLLGVIGIYGVIAYAVSQRRREIGIRVALGAPQGELKRMFMRHALTLAGMGAVIGLVAAAGMTRLMTSLLFGIAPLDPLTYTAVPFLLLAAAVLASYLPARKAAAVDPVETLKAE